MNRSGYGDDCDDNLALGRWRAQVKSAIRGKRGQAFLRELAAAMDATPEADRHLISGELIDSEGCCCTIGVVCKARGLDVSQVNVYDPEQVGALVGIARQLAAEIEFENDENDWTWDQKTGKLVPETPRQRWDRMRRWVELHIKNERAA